MSNRQDIIKQLSKLQTEQINPDTVDIDKLGPVEIIEKINREDAKVATIVLNAKAEIAAAAEIFADVLRSGGRVFYIGAGTSGRLGVLDAAECPPTFGTDPSQVVGLISGGYDTLVLSREGVEDNREAAVNDLKAYQLSAHDLVIGLAASTRTPYTLAGLEYAHQEGARTAFICCNELGKEAEIHDCFDIIISLPVGPEAITGSTRMKSGTAQKMTLNMISTTAMVLLGKTYGNLMVDLKATSEKLAARSRKILIDLLKVSLPEADRLLADSGGSVKIAIVMKQLGCDRREAEARLGEAEGFISAIISP